MSYLLLKHYDTAGTRHRCRTVRRLTLDQKGREAMTDRTIPLVIGGWELDRPRWDITEVPAWRRARAFAAYLACSAALVLAVGYALGASGLLPSLRVGVLVSLAPVACLVALAFGFPLQAAMYRREAALTPEGEPHLFFRTILGTLATPAGPTAVGYRLYADGRVTGIHVPEPEAVPAAATA